ncbi:MAG: ribonuclease E/G, partial [Geminicoccaceae bacterium]|nr:ribonuclease E/G [Geminicoccaceae bacterium]
MTKRMLVDATHPEETRVVVVDNQQLVDFDVESSTKRQLKGNVYLAKITRVEPSLQAAFVEYGGNRHGFLAFSEIHPDYYQIPQADRNMLERLERESARSNGEREPEPEPEGDADGEERPQHLTEDADEETADVVGEQARVRARLMRSYKIQEVIKRRQIMLVQVVKEERGTKGAALTTYLSLAGRYCVLMPNTPRGGGISRKIQSVVDRKRLKSIVQELDVPEGMGLIVRTAGQERTRAEIRRDYDYLLRLWDEIRETTLKSIAPTLIYEEGNLIKRAIRDLYTRDIEEVLVEGDEAYKDARRLMQMIMPSRARLVKPYKEEIPLFFRHRVEDHLDAMHSPTVQLPSGGSIVIHTTEALTAIDVNSGRSTRERHIDETAVKTNLEAADEVARQLRLRDLAGLIVIDFIDMSESRHEKSVERRLREALKMDRARIQLGKISMFGLMELSRQRLRPSLQELSSQACPTCQGLGVVRSTESCALHVLRLIQEEGIKGGILSLQVTLPSDVALYILNRKRDALVRLEQRYLMKVIVGVDRDMLPPQMSAQVLERREPGEGEAPRHPAPVAEQRVEEAPVEETSDEEDAPERAPAPARASVPAAGPTVGEEDEQGRRRRRRRRGGRR